MPLAKGEGYGRHMAATTRAKHTTKTTAKTSRGPGVVRSLVIRGIPAEVLDALDALAAEATRERQEEGWARKVSRNEVVVKILANAAGARPKKGEGEG